MDSLIKLIGSEATRNWVPQELTDRLGVPRSTLNRWLREAVSAGKLVRIGAGPKTAYRTNSEPRLPAHSPAPETDSEEAASATSSPDWSEQSRTLIGYLRRPVHGRKSSTYERSFVDEYVPNVSRLLPRPLAHTLRELGAVPGQRPAGTYARNALQPLLIDLSWSSSRLEGNTYSLLDTKELFESGQPIPGKTADETAMLLNHKAAIEFLVEDVPERGLTVSAVTNLHAVLMQDLLHDPAALGRVRQRLASISGTQYIPQQVPQVLEEMLNQIVDKAASVEDPLEASFFLWINIAYLQPFEDGNKRTSRLACNIPLLLANYAPLAFLNVDESNYALAMLGVYERRDVSIAKDLFEFAYRFSIERYADIKRSLGEPNEFRLRYRFQLTEAVQGVVRTRRSPQQAVAAVDVQAAEKHRFEELLAGELNALQPYNCARYRLRQSEVEAWIAEGRPMVSTEQ